MCLLPPIPACLTSLLPVLARRAKLDQLEEKNAELAEMRGRLEAARADFDERLASTSAQLRALQLEKASLQVREAQAAEALTHARRAQSAAARAGRELQQDALPAPSASPRSAEARTAALVKASVRCSVWTFCVLHCTQHGNCASACQLSPVLRVACE